jgi:hypothetical protein
MTPEIMLSNGKYFNFLKPEEAEYDIEEIAHALSHICRFTGHCKYFYSVAQHSVLVSHLVPQQYAMMGLLHDAQEAFVSDMATPLKQMMPDYKALEKRIEKDIAQRFNLPFPFPPEIKQADIKALATEVRDLLPGYAERDHGWECIAHVEPHKGTIFPLSSYAAAQLFLKRYWDIYYGQA